MAILYVLPTPIGNLGDITLRTLQLLGQVDFILAEDTRQTAKLLQHYQIKVPLRAFHAHNEHGVLNKTVNDILTAQSVGLVSDAGTPGISDPGFLLIRACLKANITIQCLPGSTAFVPALVASGLPCDRFVFEGFLPHKKGRQTRLKMLTHEVRTIIFYESPFRLATTLKQLATQFGPARAAAVCRELTKIHEEVRRDTLENLALQYEKYPPKGEIVLIVSGCEP